MPSFLPLWRHLCWHFRAVTTLTPAITPLRLYRGRRRCVKCHTLQEITALMACWTFGVWPRVAECLQTFLWRRLEPAKPNKISPLSHQSRHSGALQSLIDWLMGRGRRVRPSVESSAGGSRLQSEPISSRASAPSSCMDGSICANAAVSMKYLLWKQFYKKSFLNDHHGKKSFGCQFKDWFFPKTQQSKFSQSLCTNYRNSCCNFCFALETLEENLEAGCLLRRFPIEESII